MFYKLDYARVTLREFWWETKLFAWLGVLVQLRKIRLRGSTDDLAVDSLRPFLVEEAAIPPEMLARFGPVLNELQALGFGRPVWHYEEDVMQATRNTLATLLHSSGRTWARVQCRINFARVPARVKFFTTLIAKTPGGFVVTGNGKYDMAWPASHEVARSVKMPVGDVWARHQQRIAKASPQLVAPGQLLDVAEEYHRSLRDFHLARGVFVPLAPDEIALHAAPPLPPPLEGAMDTGLPAPDLLETAALDELQRLQNKQANWRFSLALLALSAAFFILRSKNEAGKQSWEYVGILVGVLLFHELGHYLAMKLFGYRNLRMFFIPGFGAAVSGRHYNAPAWKKIVVSLMGPLPGVIVGSAALITSLFTHNDLLYRIGLFAVIINAFNLIPILPFDGGWVAHAALFSRHPKLDVGFRAVAAALLFLIGLKVPGTSFLPYIAVAGLVTLPTANKLAKIVSELRGAPELGVSPDSQTIPTPTARIILSRVRQHFTRNLNARLAAQHVASVFESLNARPPSAGATVGLLFAHAGGFGVAVLALVIGIGVHGRMNRRTAPLEQQTYAIVPGEIEGVAPENAEPHNTLVARFKDDRSAAGALHALAAPRTGTRFGQTLFVDFTPTESAAQQALFRQFKARASDVFVASGKLDAQVELSFKPPTSPRAQSAIRELEAYLSESRWGLIPPWASDADWPADQRAPQTTLRLMLKELRTIPASGFTDQREVWKKINEARLSGDTAEADRLQAEQKAQLAAAEKKRQEALSAKYQQPELVAKYVQIAADKNWKRQQKNMKETFAPLLGQWPAAKPPGLLVTQGYSFDVAKSSRVYCRFKEIEVGLPALTRWLYARGVEDIHYTIEGTPSETEPSIDEDDPTQE